MNFFLVLRHWRALLDTARRADALASLNGKFLTAMYSTEDYNARIGAIVPGLRRALDTLPDALLARPIQADTLPVEDNKNEVY